MSDPAKPPDSYDALLFRIADKITPLFQTGDADLAAAKQAALSAIAAYHPESRADFVNIARVLAFSMAALSALAMAAADDLPPALKMRYFGRANTLNRSAEQAERAMLNRRRDQRANRPVDIPGFASSRDHVPPAGEPMADDPAIDTAVTEAIAAFKATQAAGLQPAAKVPPPKAVPQVPVPTNPPVPIPPMLIPQVATLQAPVVPRPIPTLAVVFPPALPQASATPEAASHNPGPPVGQRSKTLYRQNHLQRSGLRREGGANSGELSR